MVSKKLVALIGAGCMVFGLSTGLLIGKATSTSKQAYALFDYNRDGIEDLTIEEKNGKKEILYGFKTDMNGTEYPYKYYAPSSEMKERMQKLGEQEFHEWRYGK